MIKRFGQRALLLLLAACSDSTAHTVETEMYSVATTTLAEVRSEQWERLAARPVFFGHQSVGRDLLAGLKTVLAQNPEIGIRIVNVDQSVPSEDSAFFEANIGKNRFPETKADAFAAVLRSGFGTRQEALVMYKYCYVDLQPESDPDRLFADYVTRIEALKQEFPEVTVVHFTLPLMAHPQGSIELLKTRMGMTTETALNVKRNRYNDQLRLHYGGREPIFDLAALESTRADGSRAYTELRGEKVYMLAPEWTHDGGHLNEPAQVRFAEQFLVFLAQLDGQGSNGALPDLAALDVAPEHEKGAGE